MGKTKFRVGRYFAILTTLVALTGVAASAQAASFRKGWDPLFSVEFSDLVGVDVGWRGEALIFVDDLCVAPGFVSFPDSCGTANVQSYELEFYDVNTDAQLGFGSDSAPGTPTFPAVTEINFDSSSIPDAIGLADAFVVPGSFSFGTYPLSFTAYLSFVSLDGPSLTLVENCESVPAAEGDVVGIFECGEYENDGLNYPPTVNWSQVPTPASLALVGIGLLALGMIRRRTA